MTINWDGYDDPDNPEPKPPDSTEKEYEEPELPEPKPERPSKNDFTLYNRLREGFLTDMEKCDRTYEGTKDSIYHELTCYKKEQEAMGLSNETIHWMKKKTLEELAVVWLKRKGLYDRKEFAERMKENVKGDEIILTKLTPKNLVLDKSFSWVLFDALQRLTRDQRAVLWFLMKKLLNTEMAELRKEPFYFTPAELQNALGKKNFMAWQIKDALDRLGMITIPYVYCYTNERWEKIEVGTREQVIQPYWEETGQAVARKDVPEEHRTKWLFGAKFGDLFKAVVIYNLLQKRYRLIPVEAFKLKDRAEIVLEYFLLHEDLKSKVVRINYETFWKTIFMTSEPKEARVFIADVIKKALDILEDKMKIYWGWEGRGINAVFYLSKSEERLEFCRLKKCPHPVSLSLIKRGKEPCRPKTSRELIAEKVDKFR